MSIRRRVAMGAAIATAVGAVAIGAPMAMADTTTPAKSSEYCEDLHAGYLREYRLADYYRSKGKYARAAKHEKEGDRLRRLYRDRC